MCAVTILHQDRQIIVCVKPVGMDSESELPSALMAETGAPELRTVHRLDRAVGGVMVYARTRSAAAALTRAIMEGRMEKRYLAVCAGRPEPGAGEMRDLLFRDAEKNKSFVVGRKRRGVREAALWYRTLDTREGVSLAAIQLETGRSHQIRVQFASRGHPLLGDGKYGSTEKGCTIALWSRVLAFPHPATAELVTFTVPPPAAWPWSLFEGLT